MSRNGYILRIVAKILKQPFEGSYLGAVIGGVLTSIVLYMSDLGRIWVGFGLDVGQIWLSSVKTFCGIFSRYNPMTF